MLPTQRGAESAFGWLLVHTDSNNMSLLFCLAQIADIHTKIRDRHMTKLYKYIFLAVSTVALTATAASLVVTDHSHEDGNYTHGDPVTTELQHGGGLDSCGGHMNHKTGAYHYHRTPKC